MEPGQLVGEWMEVADAVPFFERGDLIEFRRTVRIGGAKRRVYTHWALYIGILEEIPRVVHISTDDGDFGPGGRGKGVDSMNKIFNGSTAEVRCDPIFLTAGDDMVRVNNGMDASYRPFPPSIIVERATHKLGAGDYNLAFNNCEHFVKWCRYGKKHSHQAVAAKGLVITSLLAVGCPPMWAAGMGLLFVASATQLNKYISSTFPNRSFF